MEAPLNIALTQTPTRQITWRVVRILVSIFCSLLLVLAGYRLCFAWNSVVPSEGSVHLRIPKSPTTIANLKSLTNGIEAIQGIPWSLDALLGTSNRVLNIGFEGDGSTVVILDRALDSDEQLAFSGLGATLAVVGDETVITNAPVAPPIDHSIWHGLMQTLFTSRDATLSAGGNVFGITITSERATIRGLSSLAAPAIDSAPTADTMLYASMSPSDLTNLSGRVFTQNTPGLSDFFAVVSQNGITAAIRGTHGAVRYTLATPITEETRDLVNESSLRALAEELTEIPTIDGLTDFLDDGSKTVALRSREDATLVLRDESPYRFITATSSAGSVTITETPTYLTVSNDTTTAATIMPSCLSGATAFVKPATIQSLLPERIQYEPQTLSSFLWRASTIASSSSTTRICAVD
jgi:hypothetical protein